MERLNVPVELKLAGDGQAGEFEGYASLFGVVDDGGDMVAPGAFAASLAQWKARGALPPMYLQHGPILGGPAHPVGVWTRMEEDVKGLRVAGRIVGLDTETGRFNRALIKEGAMRGLSIGYKAKRADYGKAPGEPRRTLKEIILREVSVVDDPMLAPARIDSIKSLGEMTERDIERWLVREAGLPRSEAKALLAGGFKALKAERDAGDGDGTAAALRRLIDTLKR